MKKLIIAMALAFCSTAFAANSPVTPERIAYAAADATYTAYAKDVQARTVAFLAKELPDHSASSDFKIGILIYRNGSVIGSVLSGSTGKKDLDARIVSAIDKSLRLPAVTPKLPVGKDFLSVIVPIKGAAATAMKPNNSFMPKPLRGSAFRR